MTDLDPQTLRRALQPVPGPPATLNVGLVMRRGRRLRSRRRLTVAVGSLCAAAILAGSVTAITGLTGPAPTVPSQPVGPAQHAPDQHGTRRPDLSAPPRPQPSEVLPTSTPRATSLPPAASVPPEATPSPVISSPGPTASPTSTPTPTPTRRP